MCTVEGNTDSIAATGTAPHTDTTGYSRLQGSISHAVYRTTGTINTTPVLLRYHYSTLLTRIVVVTHGYGHQRLESLAETHIVCEDAVRPDAPKH